MPEQPCFDYGAKEVDWLKSRDPALGAAMDAIGHISRGVTPDLFVALVNSIIGQQISTKAQATIWQRIQDRHAPITAGRVAALPVEDLQSCGISFRKADYIKEIAASVLCGDLDLDLLSTLPDADLCERLCRIRGIGVWTAEMLMIFALQRPDVLSRDDLAILRGLRMLYRHRKITPALFARYKRRYSPHATVASLYLWAIAGGACPNLVDLAATGAPRKKITTKKTNNAIQAK